MHVSAITDIGIKRQENQDSFWYSRLEVDGEEVCIAAVADGMGGLAGGKEASEAVLKSVRSAFEATPTVPAARSAVSIASREIYERSRAAAARMGTTCSIIILRRGTASILHVGDSRVYLVKHGSLHQLTTDHSAIGKFERMKKEISDSVRAELAGKLTRAVGVKEHVEIDEELQGYTAGDEFLLCSDGFWHLYEELQLFRQSLSLEQAVEEIKKNGESDNITAVLVRV